MIDVGMRQHHRVDQLPETSASSAPAAALIAVGELALGVAFILGAFTGIAALFGSILNFSFVFAGSEGVNSAMILVSGLLVLAWRNAGWYGLDRLLLALAGTPWQRGALRPATIPPALEPNEREDTR